MELVERDTAHTKETQESESLALPPAMQTRTLAEEQDLKHTCVDGPGVPLLPNTHTQTNKTTYALVYTTWSSRWDTPPHCVLKQEEMEDEEDPSIVGCTTRK